MAEVLEALKTLYRQDETADEDEQGIGADDGSSEALSKVLLTSDVSEPGVSPSFLAKTTSTVLQEIFTNYKPSSINRGLPHPGSIAEATSLRCRPCHIPSSHCLRRVWALSCYTPACSAIQLPSTSYPLYESITDDIVDNGKLSQLQLESVLYACSKHLSFLPSGESESLRRSCVLARVAVHHAACF